MSDPLEALRLGTTPVDPDPAFAASLRERLIDAALHGLHDAAPNEEEHMTNTGDVSYLVINCPDLDRAVSFFGAVLGWEVQPGHEQQGRQVTNTEPKVGLWGGDPISDAKVVPAFRVDDLAAATERVRAAGGTASEPETRPYGLESECSDTSGMRFWLHQIPGASERLPEHGRRHGDVCYLTLVAPDPADTQRFFGAAFDAPEGTAVVRPSLGMHATGEHDLPDGVTLAFRVDDVDAAAGRVREAGGVAGEMVQQPYAKEVHCEDGQGLGFFLLEL